MAPSTSVPIGPSVLLFAQEGLISNSHTLEIEVISGANNALFLLDYFVVGSSQSPSSPSSHLSTVTSSDTLPSSIIMSSFVEASSTTSVSTESTDVSQRTLASPTESTTNPSGRLPSISTIDASQPHASPEGMPSSHVSSSTNAASPVARSPSPNRDPGSHLAAIIGGAIGGGLVLIVTLVVALLRHGTGHRRRGI